MHRRLLGRRSEGRETNADAQRRDGRNQWLMRMVNARFRNNRDFVQKSAEMDQASFYERGRREVMEMLRFDEALLRRVEVIAVVILALATAFPVIVQIAK